MNFKEWLLISEEEEKDINLSNPKLTTTIPPLNTSQERDRKNSSDRFKELAIYYGRNKSAPSTYNSNPENKSLGIWFSQKKIRTPNPHEEYDKTWAEIVSEFPKWIDPDTKQPFLYTNLPVDWRDVKSTNAWQEHLQKNRKNISDRFKELAIYYGRNKSAPSTYNSNPENKSLGIWFSQKKIRTPNPHEEYDKTWAEIVSEFPKWIDPDTKQPFKYPNLPIDWRKIKPNVKQEEGKKLSSERLEKLAYYYGEKGSAPSTYNSNPEIVSLGRWLTYKKHKPNLYEKSDDITWAQIVALSKNWNKEDFPHELPIDWRKIETSDTKSLGEKYVENILKELEIKNDPQHRDKACVSINCLSFDFLITNNGKKYLEFHGEQHYLPVYFGSKKDKTDQEKAKLALKELNKNKKRDEIKYKHCVKENIPFLVIPYWLDQNSDIIKNTIIEFLKTNQFNETFANPDVPPEYKAYHDRKLKMTECFADGKIPNCKELFKKQKTTFEQFLINKIL